MTESLPYSLLIFAASTIVIAIGGVLLTKRAEQIAKITGLGQLLTGAVLIGAVTSLSGSITSVTAAWEGNASLAVTNALGGIAVQTTFLAIADMAYRRANLEYAAASEPNMLQGVILIGMLALPLVGMALPGLGGYGLHPVSVIIVVGYVLGLRLTRQAERVPMWQPRLATGTAQDEIVEESKPVDVLGTWTSFGILALMVAGSGWVMAQVAPTISTGVGLDQSLMGGLFTATATSLPELVVAVTAVRRGALSLAVGDILGGNAFDVLILTASDVAYRGGTIYEAIASRDVAWVALSIVLVSVLLLGLLRRHKHGFGNLGFETVLMLALYVAGVAGIAMA
ncbi:sodium:calcium antiporter [Mycolicibacterium hippocampi]|uniref:Cation transporter n=1 Tax=Mycolicibacterium hippocampi TaxID=659824 RepID=A0A7I9ZUW2_9MYCO|nr:sodium:calcium antiporter [Mycolicibacterium hippocampi]GFH04852.1 cation transporter [Mycolicibacterium hippocampi]